MRVSLIVATAGSGVIGRGGRLPWHLPADLKRFKELTMGHAIVMGRKTFESIGRCLPGRTTIVLSRTPGFAAKGAVVAGSFDDAMRYAADDDEVFIIGGAEIYRLALPHAARLYVTVVHTDVEGDTFFPDVDWDQWQLVEEERHTADEKNPSDFTFRVYERAGKHV